jgi:hypothetical protein
MDDRERVPDAAALRGELRALVPEPPRPLDAVVIADRGIERVRRRRTLLSAVGAAVVVMALLASRWVPDHIRGGVSAGVLTVCPTAAEWDHLRDQPAGRGAVTSPSAVAGRMCWYDATVDGYARVLASQRVLDGDQATQLAAALARAPHPPVTSAPASCGGDQGAGVLAILQQTDGQPSQVRIRFTGCLGLLSDTGVAMMTNDVFDLVGSLRPPAMG